MSRTPIRARLGGGSALLTFLVLGTFALVVGLGSAAELRDHFHHYVSSGATSVERLVESQARSGDSLSSTCSDVQIVTENDDAAVRLVFANGRVQCGDEEARNFGPPTVKPHEASGFYIESRRLTAGAGRPQWLQYGRPVEAVEGRISAIAKLLIGGVLVGTALAFFVGLAVARVALNPIAELTAAAGEIERTLTATRRLPQPQLADEVGELSRTMDRMVKALERSRANTEAVLASQRAFVADASHELGTPLTSLLANLEFISDQLEGEHGEAGESAYRSAQRLKAMVADLLLLAQTDSGRAAGSDRVDLEKVVQDVLTEIKALATDHVIEATTEPVFVLGSQDDLYRLTLNLVANGVRHTPPGTRIEIKTSVSGDQAILVVEDNGPGVPPAIAPKIFERFVKGRGSRKGSTGLGLAIVRAVAEGHGGTVRLTESATGGARFVVELPRVKAEPISEA